MRSSVNWKGPTLSPTLLFHIKKEAKRVFYSFGPDTLWMPPGSGVLGMSIGRLGTQVSKAIQEIFCLLDCFGMPYCPPKRPGGGGRQRESCLECCPWELDPDKQNKTDGWTDFLSEGFLWITHCKYYHIVAFFTLA